MSWVLKISGEGQLFMQNTMAIKFFPNSKILHYLGLKSEFYQWCWWQNARKNNNSYLITSQLIQVFRWQVWILVISTFSKELLSMWVTFTNFNGKIVTHSINNNWPDNIAKIMISHFGDRFFMLKKSPT